MKARRMLMLNLIPKLRYRDHAQKTLIHSTESLENDDIIIFGL